MRNVAECREACENEKSFRCKAFDWYKDYNYCYLHSVNRFQNIIYESSSYDYYERLCEGETSLRWYSLFWGVNGYSLTLLWSPPNMHSIPDISLLLWIRRFLCPMGGNMVGWLVPFMVYIYCPSRWGVHAGWLYLGRANQKQILEQLWSTVCLWPDPRGMQDSVRGRSNLPLPLLWLLQTFQILHPLHGRQIYWLPLIQHWLWLFWEKLLQ